MSKVNDVISTIENLDPKYSDVLNMLNSLPDAFVMDSASRNRKMTEREFTEIQVYLVKTLLCVSQEIENISYEGVMNCRDTLV